MINIEEIMSNEKYKVINDDMKYNVCVGDRVILWRSNFDYTERLGTPKEAIVLWQGMNNQPLLLYVEELLKGNYKPIWGVYEDIIEIVGNIDIATMIKEKVKKEN